MGSDDQNNRDDTSEAWALSVEGNDKPVDAEFLPLDSACEEHTCPHPGRKMMVSYDVLGPGGRVIFHAQTRFVHGDVKSPLLSVGKLTEVKFGKQRLLD